MTTIPVEHVLTLTARTEPAILVPGGPQGTRGYVQVTGGTFEGGKLTGTVAAGGADWFTVRPDGSLRVDVRLLLTCADDARILLAYQGLAVRCADGRLEIRVGAQFEAPAGPHEWLNSVQGVGHGRLVDGGVRYEMYALR